MNTVQQPASEVAMTLIVPEKYYQKTSGLRSLSRSLLSILNPLIATALYSFIGLNGVIAVDIGSFIVAFVALQFFIRIPKSNSVATALYSFIGLNGVIAVDIGSFIVAFVALQFFIRIPKSNSERKESVLVLAKEGIGFLKDNPMIMMLILFMADVNLVASAFDATLPGYVLPNPKGGQSVLGIVTSCSGVAMIFGSLIVSILPKPKDRVKVIYLTMLFSLGKGGQSVLGIVTSCSGVAMIFGSLIVSILPKPKDRVKVIYLTMLFSLGTENFLLAFFREPILWCVGQIIGWILVPVMSANLDVILRNSIPVELQGRVYACRNTLQFFTIPIGLFLGGFMVDYICETLMAAYGDLSVLKTLFGTGKGSGAALMMFILGVSGSTICIIVGKRLNKYQYSEK